MPYRYCASPTGRGGLFNCPFGYYINTAYIPSLTVICRCVAADRFQRTKQLSKHLVVVLGQNLPHLFDMHWKGRRGRFFMKHELRIASA